jgi:hypothetical protein
VTANMKWRKIPALFTPFFLCRRILDDVEMRCHCIVCTFFSSNTMGVHTNTSDKVQVKFDRCLNCLVHIFLL